MAVTTPPADESTKAEPPPKDSPPPPRKDKRRYRVLPRTVLGISAFILAFSLGAAASGVVLYSYYEYRLGKTDDHVNTFVQGFSNSVKNAQAVLKAQQDAAQAALANQLAPLQKVLAEGATIQQLGTKVQPALYLVSTQDVNGAPVAATAFAVASDSRQTLLLTSYNAVQAGTRSPGPDVFVTRGGNTTNQTKVGIYTWEPSRDLALIILPVGNQPVLSFATSMPSLGDRVFAASGWGSQGASISQGTVTDVSSAGIQHTTAISQAFQGGPLLNSDGQVVGITSQTYAPLGYSSTGVWFAVPNKAACEKVLNCPPNSPLGAGSQGPAG